MLKFITDFSAFNARDTVKNVNVEIKKVISLENHFTLCSEATL